MEKKNLKFKTYRIQFAKGEIFTYLAINDDVAKLKCRKYMSEFNYPLINGTHVQLFRIVKDVSFTLEFVSKVFPFKRTHLKGVNLWTGKKTLVPVSSPHLVLSCAYCHYFLDDNSPVCGFCNGCLDCRNTYYSPLLEILTFSQLLDKFSNYEKLPF